MNEGVSFQDLKHFALQLFDGQEEAVKSEYLVKLAQITNDMKREDKPSVPKQYDLLSAIFKSLAEKYKFI